jgi:hypothetical protein
VVPTSLYSGWMEAEVAPHLPRQVLLAKLDPAKGMEMRDMLDLRLGRTVTLHEAEGNWGHGGLASHSHCHLQSVYQHLSYRRCCSLLRVLVSRERENCFRTDVTSMGACRMDYELLEAHLTMVAVHYQMLHPSGCLGRC